LWGNREHEKNPKKNTQRTLKNFCLLGKPPPFPSRGTKTREPHGCLSLLTRAAPFPLPKENQSCHHLNQRRPSPPFPPDSLPHSHFQHRLQLFFPLQQPKQPTSFFFPFHPNGRLPPLRKKIWRNPCFGGFLIFSFFSLQPGKSPSPSPGQPQPPGPHRSPPADPTDDSSKANHRCYQQERRPPTRHQPRQFLLRSSTIRTATSNGSVEPRRRKH